MYEKWDVIAINWQFAKPLPQIVIIPPKLSKWDYAQQDCQAQDIPTCWSGAHQALSKAVLHIELEDPPFF